MVRNARYGGSSNEFNSSRGYNHGRRNAIYDTDEESEGGHSAYERARGDYDDPDGEQLRRAMYNADRRESRGGSAARARGGGRGGRGGYSRRGEAHREAHENPYHGVEAFTTDEEDSDDPDYVTQICRRMARENARRGSRGGHVGGGRGGRIDPRDGTMPSRGGATMHSHHHHGYDERAGQGLDDYDVSDDSDDARIRARRRRRILDDSSEEDGDSDDARRIEEYRAAAGHNDRYGGPSRRY